MYIHVKHYELLCLICIKSTHVRVIKKANHCIVYPVDSYYNKKLWYRYISKEDKAMKECSMIFGCWNSKHKTQGKLHVLEGGRSAVAAIS